MKTWTSYAKKVYSLQRSKKKTLKALNIINDELRNENPLTIAKFYKLPIKDFDDSTFANTLLYLLKKNDDYEENFTRSNVVQHVTYFNRVKELTTYIEKFFSFSFY